MRLAAVIVGGTILLAMLILAVVMERQQAALAEMVRDNQAAALEGCLQRRANTVRVNRTWDTLARIDRMNSSLPPSVVRARVEAYEHAKLEVPTCLP